MESPARAKAGGSAGHARAGMSRQRPRSPVPPSQTRDGRRLPSRQLHDAFMMKTHVVESKFLAAVCTGSSSCSGWVTFQPNFGSRGIAPIYRQSERGCAEQGRTEMFPGHLE